MAGLDLTKTAVLPEDVIEEAQSAYSILEEVQGYLEEQCGVAAPVRPSSVPKDLGEGIADRAADISQEELAILHAQYVAYAGFIGGKLAELKAGHKIADTNFGHIKADLTTRLFTQSVAKTEIPERIKTDPLYRRYELVAMKLWMMKTIVEARYKSYEHQAASISRIISIRLEEMHREKNSAQHRRPKRRLSQ